MAKLVENNKKIEKLLYLPYRSFIGFYGNSLSTIIPFLTDILLIFQFEIRNLLQVSEGGYNVTPHRR